VIPRLRLYSGLVMLTYVTSHFLNHSLGLVSIELMDWWLVRVYRVWASVPGTVLLYGAFATHYCLALWALWRRRSLRMPPAEFAQLALGFSIPFLLTEHVVTTRVADTYFHGDYGYYASIVTLYRLISPARGLAQLIVLVVAWVHAMIGIRYNLVLRPWYGRWQPYLFAAALLIPTFAILGVIEAGREVAWVAAADPDFLKNIAAQHPRARPPEDAALLDALTRGIRLFFFAALAAVLAARLVRWQWKRWRGIVRLTYPSGRIVEIEPGLSVLEASRIAGIPHASICGGRGRCSTCRIRVAASLALPPPSSAESRVLARVGAAPDVRLACQLRPLGDCTVTPLLPPNATASDGYGRPAYMQGMEKEIAILFADIRSFTQLSESKLPYDVVFLLNRYFAEMGRAVEGAGGRVDKFIGDGVMALFGLDSNAERGSREALAAAHAMAERLIELNHALAHDLMEPLRIGIGIHAGHAIVGEMGYGGAVSVTAIGDCVNIASRLESLTKELGVQLVLSEAVAARAGLAFAGVSRHEIEIRGRVERLKVLAIASALDLPPLSAALAARQAVAAPIN
jgi:adenylate cyclase